MLEYGIVLLKELDVEDCITGEAGVMSHGLKKGFIGMMWMACAAAISACSPSPAAEPAVLPPEEQVRTVSVERDGVAADCGNREQIGELLSILADMEPTNLQSVQDVPQADEYTSIHFEDTEGRVYTIFYYETDGTDYVEQSYQGIYKPASALGWLLDSLLKSGEAPINDRIPMVMADGAMYYDTGRESTVTGRCGVMDGEITSAVERTEVPSENNQSNFGAGYGYQWGPEEGTLEVCMDGKWLVFERRYADDSRVYFAGRWHDKSGLSEDTLRWLAWYNGLSEEEQACISAVPADLLDESGISRTEETDAQAD